MNPFINTTQSVNLKVNNVKPSVTGNINLGISDIPNLQNQLATTFLNISSPNNNDGLVYNATDAKFENKQIDHTTLSNIGTNTHSQIDTFINSKSQANGVASLDPYGKLNINQIPASIINNVFTCNTLADMNALTNIHTGDVAIVTADTITSNNNSYINNGTSWIEISMYIAPITIDTLKNVNITSVSNGNILTYNNASSKWINSNSLTDSLLYFQNNSDNTKQLQFSLSALTTGTTITLTSPNVSCNILGDIATQTLTNKTIDDTTNIITADKLHSATSTIVINNATAPSINQALVALGSTGASWQTISHLNLSNIGTNTHAQIDTFISSKDAASGIAGLDSNSLLKINEFPNFCNNISFYVDSKYTGGSSNGSKIQPFTTIQAALNAIGTDTGATRDTYGSPTNNADPHIHDQFSIYVEHGIYNETITIPAYRFISLIACGGLVSLGSSNSVDWSSTTSIQNVYINVYKNPSVTSTFYQSTVIFASNTLKTNENGQLTHENSTFAWLISGTIYATFINGSANTSSDWFFNQMRVLDANNTGNFIMYDPNSTYVGGWSNYINSRFFGCNGNAVTVYDSVKCSLFNIMEISYSYFTGILYCFMLGKIIDSSFTSTSGVTFNTLTNYNSAYAPYYSGLYNTNCFQGCCFTALTGGQVLYMDNQTYIKSNPTGQLFSSPQIGINGYLTLNIDYGFPNPIAITSPSANQVIQYNTTTGYWNNSTLSIPTALHSLTTDVNISSPSNNQYLVYNSASSKWINSSLTLNYALAGLTTDVNISSPSSNQVLQYNGTKWVNNTLSIPSALSSLTTDTLISSPSSNQVLQYNGTKWVNSTLSAGSTTLASDTDVNLTSLTNSNLLIYNTSQSKWVNSNSLTDSLLYFQNNSDNTKKLQFSLSGLTTGTTITLTSPNVSCNIVGDIATQTLTNKTIDSTTNVVTADKLHSATSTIVINNATAPTSGQILTATSSTNAIWSNNNANAYSLYCSGNTIDVSNAGTPSANQVLTATSSSTATWQTVTATSSSTNNLNTTGATVNINASAPPATGQILVATSATTATWQNIPLNSAATNIYSCNDANISNPTTNNVLVYGSCSSSNAKQLILTVSGLYIINMMANRVTYMIYNGAPYSGTSVFFCELITFNNTLYGFTNTALIYTSTDPNYKIWTQLTNNLSTIFSNLAYTLSTSNRIGSYSWVINDGTYFYACGYTTLGSGYNVARSADSITWTGIGTQSNLYYVYGMFYIPSLTNKYYTTGSNSGNNVSYINASSDGVNFTQTNYSSYFYNTSAPCTQISYQNSIIFITQGYYGNNGSIYSTNNGSSWNKITMGANNYCICICWSPTLSLYIGIDTYNGVLYSSPDLSTWTARISGYTTMMLGKCYWLNNNYFLLVNNDGNIYYSVDGINWSLVYSIGVKIVNVYTDQYLKAWCNTNLTLAGTINDVQISNPQNGQSLKYNSSLGKWVNSS